MSKKMLFLCWGVMYAICCALAFLPAGSGWVRGLLLVLSLLFFLPPMLMLYQANSLGDKKTIRQLRTLSLISLIATLALIVMNFLSVGLTATEGTVLYVLLIFVSAPMICSGVWVVSLFLWACLLWGSIFCLKKKG